MTGERLTRRGPPSPSPVLDVRGAKVDQQSGDGKTRDLRQEGCFEGARATGGGREAKATNGRRRETDDRTANQHSSVGDSHSAR